MKVFTTGQVAKVCRVAPRTVSKWVDSGRLKGYRIPGSQDRRIPCEYLIKFLREHGMPLGELADETCMKVLVVSSDTAWTDQLKAAMPAQRAFAVATAAAGFDAGYQAGCFRPDCIVVDFGMGRTEAVRLCQQVRRNPEFAEVLLIAVLSDDGVSNSFDRSCINETFRQPCDSGLLAARIETLVAGRKQLV